MKTVKLIIAAILISMGTKAQSIFKRLPVPQETPEYVYIGDSIKFVTPTVSVPKTQTAWRFIANVASYSIPDNSLMSGGGIGYQWQKYDSKTKRWNVDVSLNLLSWYKKSLDSKTTEHPVATGVAVGLWNNKALLGVATDYNKVFGTVGIGISLN